MEALQARFYRYDKKLEALLKRRIYQHLIKLPKDDRYTRFFAPLSDEAIKRYVEKLGENDELFLTFAPAKSKLKTPTYHVTGFLHVGKMPGEGEYEIGVSVDPKYRQHGLGTKLFDRAFTWVQSVGCKKIYVNCLSSNVAMQHIVDKYKMLTTRDPDDFNTKTAVLELEGRPDFYAYLKGLAKDQIALFDLALKQLHA